MFLTCFTYRQATWNPDCSWTGGFTVPESSTRVTSGSYITVGIVSTNTRTGTPTSTTTQFTGNLGQFITTINQTLYTIIIEGQSGSYYINTANSALYTVASYTSTLGGDLITNGLQVGNSNGSSSYLSYAQSGITSARLSVNINALTSTSSYVSLGTTTTIASYSTYIGTTTFETSIKSGTMTTSSTTSTLFWTLLLGSTLSSSGLTSTSSSSASASGTHNSQTVSSTVTGTTGATVTIVSTTTATTSVTRFSAGAGTVSLTTAQTTTTRTSATTGTISANTTSTISIATPAWWGWSYEIGTLLLATGNTGTDDLPLWLEQSNWTGSVAGLWNFSTATQTTLWPSQPTAQVNHAGTIQASALTTTTTSVLTASTFTWYGSSTTGTSTAGSSIVVFSESTSTGPVTASVPFAQTSGSVTSWANLSASETGSILTPINTTTSTYAQTGGTSGNYTPDIMTVMLSTVSGYTTTTSYTLTTLTAGYFTTSVASGSPNNILTTTGLTTASMQSATTTSSADTWFVDWSNPTQTVSSTTASSTTTTTSTNNPISTTINASGYLASTQITITSTLSTVEITGGGTSGNFTQNQFAVPYLIPTLVTALSTTAGLAFYQPGSVGVWSAIPSQQAFVNPKTTSITYQSASITAPSSASSISILAAESGAFRSFNSISGPICTTSTGLWVVGSSPSTLTTSISTTTSTNSTQTATSSTKQAVSNSWTGPTVSYTNSVTSTFMESAGFTRATSDTHTESWLGVITQILGSITKTSNYISTQIGNAPVTWSQNTTAGTVFQYFPGAGGSGKFHPGPVTLNVSGAAVSLSGNSTTWSTATPAFLQVVIGGSFTTTSSTTSSLAGAGAFSIWTIPGIASVITSPAYSISTCRDRFVHALTSASRFWLTPDPFPMPMQATSPQPAR
jgi:mucin-22